MDLRGLYQDSAVGQEGLVCFPDWEGEVKSRERAKGALTYKNRGTLRLKCVYLENAHPNDSKKRADGVTNKP